MPVPELHSLEMKFRRGDQWETRRIDVVNPNVATLRYDDISVGPFFERQDAMWKPTPEPHARFGVPSSSVTDSERRFMSDYLSLVAQAANDWGVEPTRAPACLPQVVFELFDEERVRREARRWPPIVIGDRIISERVLVQPRHLKKHPADLSFFCDGYWRILEIDGPSHLGEEGRKKTEKRNQLYKAIGALVVSIEPYYDNELTSLIEVLKLLEFDLAAIMKMSR